MATGTSVLAVTQLHPTIDTYVLPIIAAIVVLSLLPVVVEMVRSHRSAAAR